MRNQCYLITQGQDAFFPSRGLNSFFIQTVILSFSWLMCQTCPTRSWYYKGLYESCFGELVLLLFHLLPCNKLSALDHRLPPKVVEAVSLKRKQDDLN